MEDARIVELFFARSESALSESQKKYGRSLLHIASGLLHSDEDAKECENDTYLTAWHRIPPDRPTLLGSYLQKICRYLALNMLRKRTADKRIPECTPIEELAECIPGGSGVEEEYDRAELRRCLNAFLRELPGEERYIFVRRYFYGEELSVIAGNLSCSEGKIKSQLFRTRQKLKNLLTREELL